MFENKHLVYVQIQRDELKGFILFGGRGSKARSLIVREEGQLGAIQRGKLQMVCELPFSRDSMFHGPFFRILVLNVFGKANFLVDQKSQKIDGSTKGERAFVQVLFFFFFFFRCPGLGVLFLHEKSCYHTSLTLRSSLWLLRSL